MKVDINVLELIASRICHAMAATVGAVGNGVELIEEFDDSMRDEAMELVSMSAGRAADQVKFFRMAYGSAGYEGLGNLGEVKTLAGGIVDQDKFSIDWSELIHDPNHNLEEGLGKLLLLMVELASEALMRDGEIVVSSDPSGTVSVAAVGKDASVEANLQQVLASAEDAHVLTARTVHGRYAMEVATSIGRNLIWETRPGGIRYLAMRLETVDSNE